MRIERRFTKPGQSPYAEIEFRKAVSEIKNPMAPSYSVWRISTFLRSSPRLRRTFWRRNISARPVSLRA